ncbi:hypothetical protein [Streptomyces sp. NPDC008001]|uniref:hypothetical protein n=1 Tax=Streptomyces sp. NPDC008001 TaxID=3364804 RepID=UPI0036EB2329
MDQNHTTHGTGRTKRTTGRTAALLIATAAAAALSAAGPAQAAGGPTAPPAPAPSDYAAAQQVLGSDQVHSTVSRFLTAAARQGQAPAPGAGADGGTAGGRRGVVQQPAAAPRFDLRKPVPLYELAPEFVAGKARPTAGTALRMSYLASRVSAADGHQAAVFLMPKPGGSGSWQVAGIRDGEADISAAERGDDRTHTFLEPQIHAWYRLTGAGAVEPLNKEASTALQGKQSITLAAYQQLVTKRYGDKLPGSSYDRKGLAGGYAQPGDEPETLAAQRNDAATVSGPWLPAALGTTAVAASGAAVVALRRRRSAA